MSKIEILLASFNGVPFLQQQLESVLNQSSEEWLLIISDDGSTDCTTQGIRDFMRQEPEKILCEGECLQSRGVCGNFASLLALSSWIEQNEKA